MAKTYSRSQTNLSTEPKLNCRQGLPLVQQPQHRPGHYESNTIGDSIGSIFDIPMLPNGTDPEEEAFRKRMQRKKKKGIRF